MQWTEILRYGLEAVGLVTSVYIAGKGAKGAKNWYQKRHEERIKKLRGK